MPVPPLTVEGMGSGHGVGGKTVYSQEMCGPGTATSVKTFMSGELAKLGYSATNQSLCGTTGWVVKGSLAIAWTVSDPTELVVELLPVTSQVFIPQWGSSVIVGHYPNFSLSPFTPLRADSRVSTCRPV